ATFTGHDVFDARRDLLECGFGEIGPEYVDRLVLSERQRRCLCFSHSAPLGLRPPTKPPGARSAVPPREALLPHALARRFTVFMAAESPSRVIISMASAAQPTTPGRSACSAGENACST